MKINGRAMAIATIIGIILNLLMVFAGHSNPAIKTLFAPIGLGISLVAGILYPVISTEVIARDNILGGLVAGGVCALIGIAVSYSMHDVESWVLIAGTLGSAVTGAIGGWIGRLFSSGRV